jgi:hypothetical protein
MSIVEEVEEVKEVEDAKDRVDGTIDEQGLTTEAGRAAGC